MAKFRTRVPALLAAMGAFTGAAMAQDGWVLTGSAVATTSQVTGVSVNAGVAVTQGALNTAANGGKAVYLFGGNYDGSVFFNAGVGGSVAYNGSSGYIVGTDTGSSGGWMMRGTQSGEYFGLYTFPNQCTSPPCGPWTVASSALESYRRMTVDGSGNMGIGIAPSSTSKLAVNGKVAATEVVVTTSPGADYVFEPGYRLAPLGEVAKYVEANRHLPGIPGADEMAAKGVDLAEMQAKLLAKIEELTLHMIRAEEENGALRERVRALESKDKERPVVK
jgi:hypothetical protein